MPSKLNVIVTWRLAGQTTWQSRYVDLDRRNLLLVRVARNEPAEPPVGHVHQPRAVDPSLGQSTPFVRRAQVSAGFRDRVTLARRRQLRVT